MKSAGLNAFRDPHRTACRLCTIAERNRHPQCVNTCTCVRIMRSHAANANAPRCGSCISTTITKLLQRGADYTHLDHVRKVRNLPIMRYRARYNLRNDPPGSTCRCGEPRVAQPIKKNQRGWPPHARSTVLCRLPWHYRCAHRSHCTN